MINTIKYQLIKINKQTNESNPSPSNTYLTNQTHEIYQ